jgi:ABC-type ATPase involved in cell division
MGNRTIYENIALALTMKAVSKESIRPMIQNASSLLINLLLYNKIERID